MGKKEKRKRLLFLFFLPIIISFAGLVFVFEASSVRSFSQYGDSFHFFKFQLVWLLIGTGLMFFISMIDYHKLYYLSFLLMLSTIFLLVLVLVPGIGHKAGGARRWIDLGVINFQPTELAKLSSIIYLSSWFTHRERKRFFSFLVLLAILIILIMLQPDMGTAIIVFLLSITIYFLSGVELVYLFFLLPASLAGFLVLIRISPYRFRRLMAFFNPSLDPLGITYHINQILIALSAGGLFGHGFGASRQKYLFLPEAHTDSIFAIIGEELGFLGSIIILFIYGTFLFRIYQIAINARDRFGRLLGGGVLAFFALQFLINLAGMVNLLPLTGVPLPLISYGGSNLLVSYILLGILANIAKR